ncbi:GGDEF domain-containing protein [Longispora sp. NPDC051575]|uniref:GGDEF domain-containing protein n=1 Tax=Longispora sp. NPDC051575 TaxID=3154943 RepID=UPI00342DBE6E
MSQLLTALGSAALGATTTFALTTPYLYRLRSRLRAVRHDATHDPLTGVPNRRGLAEAFAQSQVDGQTASVIVCDLDGFGLINKELGHDTGDALLVQVAQRLAAVGPPIMTVARLGGDEFALLVNAHIKRMSLIDTQTGPVWIRTDDADGVALTAARAAWNALAGRRFDLAGDQVPISASFGVAVARPGDTLRHLMRRADLAMIAAKNSGATVHLAPPTTEPVLERPALRDRDARHEP